MFLKYEKTYRIPVPQFRPAGKFLMSKKDVKSLLSGVVFVEEKMDGSNTGIIRHKKGFSLQKRNSLVGPSEHLQFQRFHAWANNEKYDNIMSVPPHYLIYGEFMYVVHTIFYNALPDYFLVFDIFDTKSKTFLGEYQKKEFCIRHGFKRTPLLTYGTVLRVEELFDLIPKKSTFGDQKAEGIVVKKYSKKVYMRGKIVLPEFIKRLDEDDTHWSQKEEKTNKLAGA